MKCTRRPGIWFWLYRNKNLKMNRIENIEQEK